MKLLKRQKSGFAMVTVLIMTGLLLILMLALISLTSDTLYRSTADVERSTIVPLAEAAINEALMKIKLKPSWGTANEKLLIRLKNQRVDLANISESNLPVSADSQSGLSYGNKGFYYISFEPNDAAFNGTKYISVNNLDPINNPPSSTVGWRGRNIPNGTASIVVTAAVGNTVKHIEVLVKKTLSGKTTTGSRGTAVFTGINDFSLSSLNAKPSFHSNEGTGDAINIGVTDSTKCKVLDGGSVSAQGNIKVAGTNQTSSPYFTGSTKTIPDVDMQDLVDNISFSTSKIPSGTYVVSSDVKTIYYSDVDDASPASVLSSSISFAKNNNIHGISGLTFTGPTIQFADNFQVDYDANNPVAGKTGNITIHNVTLDMDITIGKGKGAVVEGYTLYTPGNGTRDYTDITPDTGAPYKYGNMKVINDDTKDVIKGRGNFYSRGVISFEGKTIAAGYSPEQVALLSDGDINLDIKENAAFSGLVYTKGDFYSRVDGKNLTIQGALIAAGKEYTDPDYIYDPGKLSVQNADEVKIIFDDTILSMFTYGGGSANGFTIASWHEF